MIITTAPKQTPSPVTDSGTGDWPMESEHCGLSASQCAGAGDQPDQAAPWVRHVFW